MLRSRALTPLTVEATIEAAAAEVEAAAVAAVEAAAAAVEAAVEAAEAVEAAAEVLKAASDEEAAMLKETQMRRRRASGAGGRDTSRRTATPRNIWMALHWWWQLAHRHLQVRQLQQLWRSQTRTR